MILYCSLSSMFEVTFSIFAWLGVVLVQAMVHFSLGARRRLEELESHPLESALLVEEAPIFPEGSRPVLVEEPSETIFSNHDDEVYQVQELQCKGKPVMLTTRPHSYEGDEEEEFLVGDEPQLFFQLLSQTGSEMMNVSTDKGSPCLLLYFASTGHLFSNLFLLFFADFSFHRINCPRADSSERVMTVGISSHGFSFLKS
jgi:hypothetical protein